MSTISIKYDSDDVRAVAMTWGKAHSVDVQATLLVHLEQKFPARDVSVLFAGAEADTLIMKLHSEQWKEDKEVGLTAEGSLLW